MKKNSLALCEAGIMIALSTVLAMLKLIDMPYGGSVTFAQMLPILIFAYRHGPRYGMGAALTASVIQLLLGMEIFGTPDTARMLPEKKLKWLLLLSTVELK